MKVDTRPTPLITPKKYHPHFIKGANFEEVEKKLLIKTKFKKHSRHLIPTDQSKIINTTEELIVKLKDISTLRKIKLGGGSPDIKDPKLLQNQAKFNRLLHILEEAKNLKSLKISRKRDIFIPKPKEQRTLDNDKDIYRGTRSTPFSKFKRLLNRNPRLEEITYIQQELSLKDIQSWKRTLRKLNFDRCTFEPDFTTLVKGLKKVDLRVFKFSNTVSKVLSTADAEAVASVLSTKVKLQKLRWGVESESLSPLAQLIRGTESIKVLECNHNDDKIAELINILDDNTTLESLRFAVINLGDKNIDLLSQKLRSHPNINTLDFGVHDITDKDVQSLIELVKNNQNITNIILQCDDVKPDYIAKLNELLEANKQAAK